MRRLGRLKHRIEILEQIPELDTLGRQIRGPSKWKVIARLWAEVRDLSATEVERAKQMAVLGSTAVAVRFNSIVSEKHRIGFRGRTLEIRGVLDSDSCQRELILVCGEVK